MVENNKITIDTQRTPLVSGPVKVIITPITDRYCKEGDTALLDLKNKQIRCSGSWFPFDGRWAVVNVKEEV